MISIMKNKTQRRTELSEYFDCIVKDCERNSFTQRGLEMHIKAKHPDFYAKWRWEWKEGPKHSITY